MPSKGARVGILGLAFKKNVLDLRNSCVPDIVADWQDLSNLDGVMLAVSNQAYMDMPFGQLLTYVRPGGVLMDVKSALDPATMPPNVNYWSLSSRGYM